MFSASLSGQPVQSSTPGATGAAIQTNMNAIPQQITSPAVSLTCNWTEHTSPEGFKYYYNSITRESKVGNSAHYLQSAYFYGFILMSYYVPAVGEARRVCAI
jgi:hypothetical protein